MGLRNSLNGCLTIAALMLLVGCATSSQRALERYADAMDNQLLNYVISAPGKKDVPNKTGGYARGKTVFVEANWLPLVQQPFAGGQVTVLISNSRDEASNRAREQLPMLNKAIQTAFESQLRALQSLIDKPLPKLDATYRLIPVGVQFRFEQDLPADLSNRIPLQLLAYPLQDPSKLDNWVNLLAKTAIHEYIHILRWGNGYFPRTITTVEDELQAYLLDSCSLALAGVRLPNALSTLPPDLKEDLVKADYLDIPVDEFISQLIEGRKDPPTVIGVNASFLVWFRLGESIQATKGRSAAINDIRPFCQAVARDEFDWLKPGVTNQISRFGGR